LFGCEREAKCRAAVPRDLDAGVNLIGEGEHEVKAERFRMPRIEVDGHSDAVVLHRELKELRIETSKDDADDA
jgi:hypothetical protein